MAGIDSNPTPSSWGHSQIYRSAMDSGCVLDSLTEKLGEAHILQRINFVSVGTVSLHPSANKDCGGQREHVSQNTECDTSQ